MRWLRLKFLANAFYFLVRVGWGFYGYKSFSELSYEIGPAAFYIKR